MKSIVAEKAMAKIENRWKNDMPEKLLKNWMRNLKN